VSFFTRLFKGKQESKRRIEPLNCAERAWRQYQNTGGKQQSVRTAFALPTQRLERNARIRHHLKGETLMVRFIAFVAAFVLLNILVSGTPSPANGNQPSAAASKEETSSSDWLTFYYRKPQPERFVTEVRNMSKADAFSTPAAKAPTVAFVSRVMAANPDKIPAWMAALADLPDNDQDTLHEAIWLSDTKAGKAYLKDKGLTKYLKSPPPEILKMEIDTGAVLDMLWGYFFATGEEAPIRRIVSAFNNSKYVGAVQRYRTSEKTEDDKKQALYDVIFGAAEWSLGSNCQQHPKVREICDHLLQGKDLNETEAGCLKVLLAKLTAKKDAKGDAGSGQWQVGGKKAADKDWVKSNQGFGAVLLFFDNPQQFLNDWDKPTSGVKASVSESAPRGKACGAFIVFSGCGEDKQGLADVVADMTVIKPDGKTYAEKKDVEVWQKKPAPKGKKLELSAGGLGIIIQADDPEGTYEIRAKVYDHVKGVVLELKRKFSVSK